MASSTALLTPTSAATPKPLSPIKSKLTPPPIATNNKNAATPASPSTTRHRHRRRDMLSLAAGIVIAPAAGQLLMPVKSTIAWATASDEEYVKETENVINKVRTTITMEKTDPNIATAVADLRDSSNYWVAKYRREKSLLGRSSFRDVYSALNAVSGHYISFGPTAPIPAKRKQRILEEIDTAEKALLRGR